MAPIPRPQDQHLSLPIASQQLAPGRLSEKSTLDFHNEAHTRPLPQQKSRMVSAKTLCIALFVGCLVVLGLAHEGPASTQDFSCRTEQDEPCDEAIVVQDKSALSRLIQSASPEALHKFLHTVNVYQHGVFDSDEAAAEAVLDIDPALSSTVAHLQRRQSNATTTNPAPIDQTSTSTSQEPAPPTTTTSESSTAPPPPVDTTTTTTSPSSTEATTTTETSTTTPPAETSTSTTQPPTSTEATTTPSPTSTTPTTTTRDTSPTQPPTSSPTTNTFTSTLPGGALTTLTSVAWVTAGGGSGQHPTTSASGTASLQSGVAAPGLRKPLMEVLVGAAVVGGAMLV